MTQELTRHQRPDPNSLPGVTLEPPPIRLSRESQQAFLRLEQFLAAPPRQLEECSVQLAIELAALARRLFSDFSEESSSPFFLSFQQDFPQHKETLQRLCEERNKALSGLYQLVYNVLKVQDFSQLIPVLESIPRALQNLWFWEMQKAEFLRQPYYEYIDDSFYEEDILLEDSQAQTVFARPTTAHPGPAVPERTSPRFPDE